ncbi:MAG: VTT domain-containing protein [Candidatus Portnoybacteria bacterium]|nr:VTT domain-containing protein [Candidatus Portnoybacteria bacterium]
MDYFGIDLVSLIKTVGYLGIFGIIFAESGLFIGFFFPGDSLLFTAGFLASQGFLDIRALVILTFLGAVLGDSFGYAFGKKVGPRLFRSQDSLVFHKDNLERARLFYERYGQKTIVLARFMPIVRTFAPILAGVGNMRYRTFLAFNILGGIMWGVSVPLLGYYLGTAIPNPDRYLLPLVFLIVILSFLPFIIHIVKDEHHRARLYRLIKNNLDYSPKLKKAVGILCVILGLLGLLLPLVPGLVFLIIGLELIGFRLLTREKFSYLWSKFKSLVNRSR